MPRSKRHKVVSLTKVKPKDREHKTKIISDLREAMDTYSSVFVFSFENMRTSVFKDVREHFEGSKISLGKNKLMQTALGKSSEDEYKENMHLIGDKLVGESGLLFTDLPKKEVITYFENLRVSDFAKAGVVPKESIIIKPGPLTFPPDMLDQLRKLGMVVEIKNGTVVLQTGFQATTKGVALSPEQAKVLVHMGKKISVFKVNVTGYWHDGEFEDLEV
jgi:mRNA turnover protein 4